MIRLPEKHKIRTEAKWTLIILRGYCFCNCKPHLYFGNKGIGVGFNVAPLQKPILIFTYCSTFMFLFNNATLLKFLFLAFDLSWHYNEAVAADTFSCCDSSEDGKIMEGNK